MRYDTPVTFVYEGDEEFDYETGNTIVKTSEIQKLANVTDTAAEMMQLMYGSIKNGAYTIIIQNTAKEPNHIIMDGRKYMIGKTQYIPKRNPRTTTYFVYGGT